MKKTLSILLAVIMLLSIAVPVGAYADDDPRYEYEKTELYSWDNWTGGPINDGNNDEFYYGEDYWYSLDRIKQIAKEERPTSKTITSRYDYDTKTLYITGTGAIPRHYFGVELEVADDRVRYTSRRKQGKEEEYFKNLPDELKDNDDIYMQGLYPDWYMNMTRYVEKLVIGEGITEIGDEAFCASFPQLQKITLPSTLKKIDYSAFFCLPKQKCIVIPAGVKSIGEWAFDKVDTLIFKGKNTEFKWSNVHSHITIYAPKDSAIYKEWSKKAKELKGNELYNVKVKTLTNPAKPKSLKSKKATKSSVKLSWAKVKNASGYDIQYRKKGSKSWKKVTSTTNSVTVKGLKAKTNYQFRVRAKKKISSATITGSYCKKVTVKTKAK